MFFRDFKLVLQRDDKTFVSKPEEILSDGTVRPLDISHIYQGHLEGIVVHRINYCSFILINSGYK